MEIGKIYRYARPYNCNPEYIDGYPNYFFATRSPNQESMPTLDKGINSIKAIDAPEGKRIPAILISSSPHRIGTEFTPWQDLFDPDNGNIRYFGDNKSNDREPQEMPGNKTLLKSYELHSSFEPDSRKHSVPLLFFEHVRQKNKIKGYIKFQGFGIINKVELITQYNQNKNSYFSNYAYDFLVMSLSENNEIFNWKWITDRRDPSKKIDETMTLSPHSWKKWIKLGSNKTVDSYRRSVSKLQIKKQKEQMPGTKEEIHTLKEIYRFYSEKRERFEGLAIIIAESIINERGIIYKQGWVTPSRADGGADFIGRIDIGSGFGNAKIIVLGQAKCEDPKHATNGKDIARTVARLKRGWIGIYITTGYFSEPVQREVIEDKYPLIMVNGAQVAREVNILYHKGKYNSIINLLEETDRDYDKKVQIKRPEEILYI